MKKILSFLLLATMLIGCLAPCAFAVEGPAIVAESVEKLQGADKNVNVEITLENNPGIYSMQLVVYYDKNELALAGSDDAFAASIFSAEDSSVGNEVAGTNNAIKNIVPSDLRSTSKGFKIDLMGAYDEELEDTAVVTEDGIAISFSLEILAEDFGSYDYTVVVAEAYDENGEELAIEEAVGTVTYAADPFIGIYDDFTAFFNPAEISLVAGTETVDLDVRLDQNPGLWSVRIYVVYPEALTLDAGNGSANVDNNTGIFLSNSDLITGIPDLQLTDERQVQGFRDLMAADPSIVREGYHSTTLYFERQDSYDEVYTNNGVLCSLHFNVDPTLEPGTDLDITLYYSEADFLFADTDDVTGQPVFVSYYPDVVGSVVSIADCMHENTTADHLDATCTTDGYDKVICDDCGAVVEENVIDAFNHPEEHCTVEGRVDPTCTEKGNTGKVVCNLCGETVVDSEDIDATGHVNTTVVGAVDATCTEDGATGDEICDACGTVVTPSVVIEATGHVNTTLTGAADATCTEAGYTGDEICDACGATVVEGSVIDPLGHDDGVLTGAADATCTEAGYTGDTVCGVCGETLEAGSVIDPLGHGDPVLVNDVAATCTEAGYTGDQVCSVCGDVLVEGEEIRAIGHTTLQQSSTVIVEATCTENGSITRYCDVCGEINTYEEIEAYGHDTDGGTEVTLEPTCTTVGTQVTYCDFCGEVSLTEEIPALGHDYVDGFCSVCGEPEARNAWVEDENGWFYVDANGNKVTNKWMKDSSGWCYLGDDGYMVTAKWVKDSKGWCYVGDNGYMVTNKWVKDSKGWCYVGADGYCVTNKWMKDSKGWCYLGADGRMTTNKWVKDSKGWCYLGDDGYMVTNKWVKDSFGWCYVGGDGYMLTNRWVLDGSGWCYVGGSGYCVTGTKVINGVTYTFDSNGHLVD